MVVEKEFDKLGRVIKQKIAGPYYNCIWTYEYQKDTVIEKRSDSFWTKVTNHKDRTSKLFYPDKTKYEIEYDS